MIASEPTRITVKRLKKAGFTRREAKGSHGMYTCLHGVITVLVADGHRETSAALVRKVNQAIDECTTACP